MSPYRQMIDSILQFLKNWTLPVAMLIGALSYLIWHELPLSAETHASANSIIALAQPVLIFFMLFISFCKVEPKEIRPKRWHAIALLVQVGIFSLLGASILLMGEDRTYSVAIEAGMICMICPTAVAAAVVTQKLGGNAASLVSYTVIINVAASVMISAFAPLIHPSADICFSIAFARIMAKVFPMLICPLILAIIARYATPRIHAALISFKDLSFYLWAVSLALAIAVSTRSVVHELEDPDGCSILIMAFIAIASAISCVLQFVVGKVIGHRFHDTISAGQAMGQKNTVLAIWVGLCFFSPITSLAGGFYSIWHNIFNSWQLYQKRIGKM